MKGFQIQQKGERRISAALRIMLVVVLLAVQIGFVVAISYFMQEYLALAYGVVQVGALFLAVHIYNEPGELSYKLIWFILLLLAPPVGMILWFLWGGAAQKRHLPQNTKRFPDEPESVRMRSEIAVDKLTRQLPAWSRTANYLFRRDFQLYQNTSVTYLPEGAILLRNLIDRAAKAERFIFLEYLNTSFWLRESSGMSLKRSSAPRHARALRSRSSSTTLATSSAFPARRSTVCARWASRYSSSTPCTSM
jgi:cardiolipin synthase